MPFILEKMSCACGSMKFKSLLNRIPEKRKVPIEETGRFCSNHGKMILDMSIFSFGFFFCIFHLDLLQRDMLNFEIFP